MKTKIKCILPVLFLILLGTACPALADKIIYVDDDANGLNNGTSWQNAYKFLQDALTDANSSPMPIEIRAAAGIYKPDRRSDEPNGTGDRKATFQLINGVIIKGGFAGFGEPDPNDRDIEKYETILNGDLDGNDVDVKDPCDLLTEITRSENSYHVVTAIRKDETAVLDGFEIVAGNANDSSENNRGGGMYNIGSPVVRSCKFVTNSAVSGGGMYNARGSKLTNCIFKGNFANIGGGLLNISCSTSKLANSIFAENSAWVKGGGICNYTCASVTISNCTFVANSSPNGGAIFWASDLYLVVEKLRIANCILWDGGYEIWNDDGSTIEISFCDLKGGQAAVYDPCEEVVWDEGNIDVDPCFADVKNGDYHLESQAGRWDANEGRWTRDDVTSPCIDAGDPSSPIGLEPFPNGGIINMGAYGGTEEASKSYFGEPVCETIVAGDINGDCEVNFQDLAFIAFHWLDQHGPVNSNSIAENGIEYYIQVDKSLYHLGEAIEMICRVTNVEDESLNVCELSLAYTVSFELATPKGDTLFAPSFITIPRPPGLPSTIILNPGDYIENRYDITSLIWHVGREEIEDPFTRVGQYSITSEYDNSWSAEGPSKLKPKLLFAIIP